jgi:hypothetical protein
MDELAQYSDSDEEQRSLLQPPSSHPYSASAAAGSTDSSAATSLAVDAASLATPSPSTAHGSVGVAPTPGLAYHAATAANSSTAVRYKCPGCAKTYANTAGVIKHIKSVSDPGSCSFDGEHLEITCAITTAATKVNCVLGAEGQWVIQQPSKVPVRGVSWREIMGYNNSTASVSKASSGNAPVHCSMNVSCKLDGQTGDFLAKAEQLLQLPVSPDFSTEHFKAWKAAVSAFFTQANGKIPDATVSEVRCLQFARSSR